MNTTLTIPTLDLVALKVRQQVAWASGDYARIGTTLQIVGETLAEALDLPAGASALDVAAGNGNITLALARRGASVVSTDYVRSLLDKGRIRAEAEGLAVAFQVADAEALPYPDASFDAAASTFGVMFAPDQSKAAAEMLRVVRRGGRIGMANWTPDGFIGELFRTLGRYLPPAGAQSPSRWGDRTWLEATFGPADRLRVEERHFVFRAASAQDWVDEMRAFYGPVHKAFAALPPERQAALEGDLLELISRRNTSTDGAMRVPSAYAEVVVDKA
jgi:SAM-dependent methyltransferase